MVYTVDGRKIIQQKYHYIQYITICVITIFIRYYTRIFRWVDCALSVHKEFATMYKTESIHATALVEIIYEILLQKLTVYRGQ